MDELTSSSNASSGAWDHYALFGEEGQRRAQDFLAAQQAQLERLEAELLGQVDSLAATIGSAALNGGANSASPGVAVSDEALEAERAHVREQLDSLRRKACDLAAREEELEHEKSKLGRAQEARAEKVKEDEQALERRDRELQSSENKLREAQRTLQIARDEFQAERDQLATERERLQNRHTEVDAELQKLEGERRRTQSQRRHIAHELQAQRASQLAAVEKQRLALERQRAQIAESQQELAAREQACEEAESRLRKLTKELATERQELQSERDQVAQLRQHLEVQNAALTDEHDKLAARQAQITQQGRRIAHKLKAQHAAHQQEIERKRRELEAIAQTRPAEVDARLLTATAECQAMRDEIDQLRKALTDKAGDAARSREQLTTLSIEVETLRNEHDRLSQELAVREATVAGERAKLEALQSERNSLIQQLSEAASKAVDAAESGPRDEDLQRRYEMACEELRTLKRSNADLEDKLARAKAGQAVGGGGGSAPSGKLDWEAQKRRLLASLEGDFDEQDEEEAAEKASIEETIEKTDRLLEQKEHEIAELKQLLNEQSSNLGNVAVGAAAIAEAFDQDELIRQERERLQQLQQECEEKLRQAEIDISLERAKMARERVELDEKMQVLQRHKAEMGDVPGDATTPGHPGKPARGRWLTRLGLKDGDE